MKPGRKSASRSAREKRYIQRSGKANVLTFKVFMRRTGPSYLPPLHPERIRDAAKWQSKMWRAIFSGERA